MKYLLLPALALCLALAAGAQEAASPPILEEGFETLAEGLPEGWADRSTGGLILAFGGERRGAKAGRRAWRIRIPDAPSGARVTRPGLTLGGGKSYALQLWLRAREGVMPVEVLLEREGGGEPLAARRLAVGEEWRRCAVQVRLPEGGNTAAALSLLPRAPGVLYVDALRLAEGELPRDPGEPEKRNRIFNGSFELGTDGWRSAGLAPAAEGGAESAAFARVKAGAEAVESRPFAVRPDALYTVSAYLRSAHPGAKVELAAAERGGTFRAARAFSLTTEWERYSFSAPLPCESAFLHSVTLRSPDGYPFDVDGFQIEEGELSDYGPAAPVEAAAVLTREHRFPRPDALLTFPVRVHAPGKTAEGMAVRCTLQGFYGEALAFGGGPAPAGVTHAEVPIRLRVPLSGALRLVTEARLNGEPVSRSEALLTALPEEPPAAPAVPLPEPPPCPPYDSWSGTEGEARAAARDFARSLVVHRAAGNPLPDYRAALKDPAYLYPDGAARPTLAVLAAAERLLRGAAPAGKLETDALKLYLFRRGEDTLVAVWAPQARRQPVPVALKLQVLGPKAYTLMGNAKGVVTEGGIVGIALTDEPAYVYLPNVPPAVVVEALKAAAQPAAPGG